MRTRQKRDCFALCIVLLILVLVLIAIDAMRAPIRAAVASAGRAGPCLPIAELRERLDAPQAPFRVEISYRADVDSVLAFMAAHGLPALDRTPDLVIVVLRPHGPLILFVAEGRQCEMAAPIPSVAVPLLEFIQRLPRRDGFI